MNFNDDIFQLPFWFKKKIKINKYYTHKTLAVPVPTLRRHKKLPNAHYVLKSAMCITCLKMLAYSLPQYNAPRAIHSTVQLSEDLQ